METDSVLTHIWTEADKERAAQAILDWYAAFDAAWEALAEQGACDAWGGVEYRRVRAYAHAANLLPYQAEMRVFICVATAAPAVRSVTQESIQRRQDRQNQKTKE